jgi:hypothetical protein
MINLDTLQDPNQYNDVMLINVALFWNQEIGDNGHGMGRREKGGRRKGKKGVRGGRREEKGGRRKVRGEGATM